MATNRKKKTTKKPTRVHHRVVRRVTLTGATIKAMSAPHARKAKHWYERRSFWQKLGIILATITFVVIGSMYGVARWYMAKHADEPLTIGATFIPGYAEYYGLDAKDTMQAMIDDLGLRRFRLVSYWDEIEKTPGVYDFTELDWQFQKIQAVNGKVSLSIGLRQPRWPECHMPTWAASQPKSVWYPEVKNFIGKVVDRYKLHPSLDSYQLENEFFLKVFGICPDFNRDRLIDEYWYVKGKDPHHKIIVSRSNNVLGWPVNEPIPDVSAVSVYKRVWDKTLTKRYFEYPLPAWFYAFLAAGTRFITHRELIIHELQAEPWGPADKAVKDTSIDEQNKSLSPKRLTDRIEYGRATGIKDIYLWGVEMWYWRKVKLHDDSLWEAGKNAIHDRQCYKCYRPNE